MLVENSNGATSIKKEMGVAYNNTKSSCRPPVVVVDSLHQREVMAMIGRVRVAGWKEVITFILLLNIFMVGASLIVLQTHVGYENECSVSVGTVWFASRDNVIDDHYDSLFAKRTSSDEITRYGKAVKPVHREETIY